MLSVAAHSYTSHGNNYRSLTEARWATLFECFNIDFEYEGTPYKTSAGNYLPDFFLHGLNAHVEVKPARPTVEEAVKLSEVVDATKIAGYFLCGFPKVFEQSISEFEVIELKPGEKQRKLNLNSFNRDGIKKQFWPALLVNITIIREEIKKPLIRPSMEILNQQL